MADLDLSRLIQGGMDLASAFGRGDDVYRTTMAKQAQVEGLVADAAKKRNELLAQRNLGSAIQSLGGSRDLATLFAAGVDPTKLSGYQGDMQEQGFRSDAATRANAGDWNGANASLMGVANGPVQLATVEGQNLLGNVFREGGGGITTTEQGRSAIRQNDASAASSYASAARTRQGMGIDAQKFTLEKMGAWRPGGASSGGDAGGSGKTTEDERKAAGWLGQARRALKNMEDVMYKRDVSGNIVNGPDGKPIFSGVDVPGIFETYSPIEEVRNRSMSGARQRYVNASASLSEALLRAATGAGQNENEVRQKIVEITPQRGDGEEVRAQKLAGALGYLQDLEARAGRAVPANAAPPLDDARRALLDKY